jgi:hypothetical protein
MSPSASWPPSFAVSHSADEGLVDDFKIVWGTTIGLALAHHPDRGVAVAFIALRKNLLAGH